jgi:hypothetical protein
MTQETWPANGSKYRVVKENFLDGLRIVGDTAARS